MPKWDQNRDGELDVERHVENAGHRPLIDERRRVDLCSRVEPRIRYGLKDGVHRHDHRADDEARHEDRLDLDQAVDAAQQVEDAQDADEDAAGHSGHADRLRNRGACSRQHDDERAEEGQGDEEIGEKPWGLMAAPAHDHRVPLGVELMTQPHAECAEAEEHENRQGDGGRARGPEAHEILKHLLSGGEAGTDDGADERRSYAEHRSR